jgi:hypothetical protein
VDKPLSVHRIYASVRRLSKHLSGATRMDDFEVVSTNSSTIVVRQRSEGHEFQYHVPDTGEVEGLAVGTVREIAGQEYGAYFYRDQASAFATAEAKRLGLI